MISGTSLEKATLYEKYRCPYAKEMVSDLLGHIGTVEMVADIGAGTGQLARLFADRGVKVYAVEPDPAMRQVAAAAVANFPTIKLMAGRAEQTALAKDCIDLIVVGNAFQRFKPEACAELRRILKPQGWVALISSTFVNQALTAMLFSRLAALKGLASRIEKSWHRTPVQNLFGAGQIQTLCYRQSHPQGWPTFFGAACAGIEAPEPSDRDFRQFEAVNREVFDTFAVDGKIQIDYETQVSFGQPE